jgi:acetyltransferase-like isoleucine patch superfamily enzyme
VIIGNHVTIYPQVSIEDNTRVMDGSVIGRLTHRTHSVTRPTPPSYQPLVIGADSVIGCNVVLYTGVTIGREVLLADGVSIREDCVLGDLVFLGRSVMVNYNAKIGKRTRIMDLTYIVGNMTIGEDCFIAMLTSTANDNDIYLRRFGLHGHDEDFNGPNIGHYVVVGNGAIINPGVRIGDGALISSGAVATRDIPAWTIARGTPAKPIQLIPDDWREKIVALAASRGQVLEEPVSTEELL